ncbi:hypothetical protein DICPUDRAFT_92172, partial [Dictyostelium purpureum]
MSILTRDGVAPFIKSLIQMLDTPENQHLIRWGKTGESIVIPNCAEFETKLLPKYFKTGKFCSFIRQLNIYGFHKVEDEKPSVHEEPNHESSESQTARTFEFANDNFKKSFPDLLINIKRRKSVRRSLTLNNNNPNNYRAFPSSSLEDDDDDHSSSHNNGNSNFGVHGSSATTPSMSPIDHKLEMNNNTNATDHAILQQLLYQFTKFQVDYNELKYSHQNLQDSHTQLQYAFQTLQQSHQNLLERVLKLTK